MFGSVVLEVALGVIFLFLVLSLVVTTAQELIAGLLGMRSGNLIVALKNLLDDTDRVVMNDVLNHPTLRHLYRGKARSGVFGLLGNGPSYVPSRAFNTALLDTLRTKYMSGTATLVSVDELLAMAPEIVREMPDGNLKHALTLMMGQTRQPDGPMQRRIETVERRMSQWFDESMDRATGWYKRKSQAISILLSVGLVVAVNANALTYMETLWNDAALREALVAAAQTAVAAEDPLNPQAKLLLDQLGLFPIGWTEGETLASLLSDPGRVLKTLAGWVITVLAISLGAAFWFDVMKKALAFRASGPKPSDGDAG